MLPPAPRRPTPLPPALCLLGAAALLAGCGNVLPGTQLGTYQVTATAGANTCGTALGAPGLYQFDVALSESENASLLHWSWLDDSPTATGELAPISDTNPDLQAQLTATQSSNVDPTATGAGPCTMTRADSVLVTLGDGTPPATFTGTMSYAFTVETGADCSDQLVAAGGMYAELPCSLAYTIAGKRQ